MTDDREQRAFTAAYAAIGDLIDEPERQALAQSVVAELGDNQVLLDDEPLDVLAASREARRQWADRHGLISGWFSPEVDAAAAAAARVLAEES